VSFSGQASAIASTGIATANCVAAILGVFLAVRFAHGTKAFYNPWDTLRFVILAGLLPAMLSASVGVSLLCGNGLASWSDFSHIWPVWWIGDSLGVVLVAPFLILLFDHAHHSLRRSEILEAAVLLTGLSCTSPPGRPASAKPKSSFRASLGNRTPH